MYTLSGKQIDRIKKMKLWIVKNQMTGTKSSIMPGGFNDEKNEF
jgi:hypothetical protein